MAKKSGSILNVVRRALGQGQYTKAIKSVQEALQNDPSDMRMLYKLGDLYAKAGHTPQAIEAYIQVAETYFRQALYQKALAVFKQVLKLDPERWDIKHKLAKLYFELNRRGDALNELFDLVEHYEQEEEQDLKIITDLYADIVALEPTNIPYRVRFAEYCLAEGDTECAVEEFSEALAQLEAGKHWGDYLKVAERLLVAEPNHVPTLQKISEYYLTQGNPLEAIKRLQPAFTADRNNPTTLRLLARAFQEINKIDKALSVLHQLGKLLAQSNPEEALQVYDRILMLRPSDSAAQEQYERLKHLLNNQDSPLPVQEELPEEKVNEQSSDTSDSLSDEKIKELLEEAEVYLKYGLAPRVEELLNKIFAVYPNHIKALHLKAELLKNQGDEEAAARQLLEIAVAVDDREEALKFVELVLSFDSISPALQEQAYQLSISLKEQELASSSSHQSLSVISPSQEELAVISPSQEELAVISPSQEELAVISPSQEELAVIAPSQEELVMAIEEEPTGEHHIDFQQLETPTNENLEAVVEEDFVVPSEESDFLQPSQLGYESPTSLLADESSSSEFSSSATSTPSFSSTPSPLSSGVSFATPTPTVSEEEPDDFDHFLSRSKSIPVYDDDQDVDSFQDFLSEPLEIEDEEEEATPQTTSPSLSGWNDSGLSSMEAAAARLEALLKQKEEEEARKKAEQEAKEKGEELSAEESQDVPPPPLDIPPPFSPEPSHEEHVADKGEETPLPVPPPFAPSSQPEEALQPNEPGSHPPFTVPATVEESPLLDDADLETIGDELGFDETLDKTPEEMPAANFASSFSTPLHEESSPFQQQIPSTTPLDNFTATPLSQENNAASELTNTEIHLENVKELLAEFQEQEEEEFQELDDEFIVEEMELSEFVEELDEAELYMQQEEFQYALDLYETILEKEPDNQEALTGREKALAGIEELKRRKEEKRVRDVAMDIDTALGGNFSTKSRAGKRVQEEIVSFATAVRDQFPPEEGETHFELGMAYFSMGIYSEAINSFEICRQGHYREVESLKFIGQCYMAQGRLEEALASFQEALEVPEITFDERLDILFELGLAYEQNNQSSLALEIYQQVANINPTYRQVQEKIQALS